MSKFYSDEYYEYEEESKDEIDKILFINKNIEPFENFEQEKGGLSHNSIMSIINQKKKFWDFKTEETKRIWNNSNFDPNHIINKISDRITINLIEEQSKILENVCENFIESLIYNEFYPDKD